MEQPYHFAIVVAAGKGLRMTSEIKKQYLLLNGVPILVRTVKVFHDSEDIHEIILVVSEDDTETCRSKILEPHGLVNKIHIVAGGDQRQESVFNALTYARNKIGLKNDSIVLIHDGVRPFINQDLISNCIKGVKKYRACVPAIRICDTVKRVLSDLSIQKTISRENLYLIQTPQCFYLKSIFDAYEYAKKTSFSGTDDASIVEHFGGKVQTIKGSRLNIKITTPEDMNMGELYLSKI